MFLRLLLFFAVLIPSTGALAQTDAERDLVEQRRRAYELKQLRRDPIYLETYEQCRVRKIGDTWPDTRQYRREFAWSSGKQTLHVAGLLNFEEAAQLVRQKGLSPKLFEAFHSTAFHLALSDCYPGDFYRQSDFVNRLIQADLGGRVAGAAGALATWASFAGVAKIVGLGGAALVRAVSYVGAGLGLVNAGNWLRNYWRSRRLDSQEEPSEAYLKLLEALETQARLPRHMLSLLDAEIERTENQLANPTLTWNERMRLETRLHELKLGRVDQLMVLEQIEKQKRESRNR